MSLLYRAVWNDDDRADLFVGVSASFGEWLRSKEIFVEPGVGAPSIGSCANGPVEVTERRTTIDGVSALRLQLHEERPASGERWSTTVTALRGKVREQFLWVDLERVAEDFSQRPDLNAPRIVRSLIEGGADARVDQIRLVTYPTALRARPLAGLIRNPNRSLPMIVFSHDPAFERTMTLGRAESTLRVLLGAAQVHVLDFDQCAEFRQIIGDDLAVWGGSARLYLPNRDATGLRPERHRYVLPTQFGEDVVVPARIFARMLGTIVPARRAPPCYAAVRQALRQSAARNDADLLQIAEEEIERMQAELDVLKSEFVAMEDDLIETQVDLDEAVTESTGFQDLLAWKGSGRAADQLTGDELHDLSGSPASIAQAITWAEGRLSGIAVHREAACDIGDLDSANNSTSWAKLTWRGLRALHLYVVAHHEGDFRHWCRFGGHPWNWSASSKKLAMLESETVKCRGKFSDQRLLPVDPAVNPTGRIHMWSHLKIAEGGGPLAPRVYFHDDTRGSTGKVHVGFIGPHRYMENTRTN